ncbi:MAG: PTS transporter subunit EIIC [Mycoplasma sp.]|nr:PTS transporter subunit EIIC [Mycoplasma sp.]
MTSSNVNSVNNETSKKSHKKHKKISTRTGGGAKAFLSKLSGAFLLPISVLAIAGLILGIGSTIAGNAGGNEALEVFGNFIKQLGDPLFGALPLLFAAALAVSFTEEAGVAVFNAIIGYLIFSALQSVFIKYDSNTQTYSLLFGGWGLHVNELSSLFGSSLGFTSMQTSVFGGIIVGFIVQWAYNRFHTIQLPQVIAFFSGKRFVAFVVIGLMIPLVFIFLLLWPYVGAGFNWFGENSGKIPFGFDSFIFGFIERSLVPFGLHHVFYSPLWYTGAGGNVGAQLTTWLLNGNHAIDATQLEQIARALKANESSIEAIKSLTSIAGIDGNYVNLVDATNINFSGTVQGDSTTTVAMIGVNSNVINYAYLNFEYNGEKEWVLTSMPLYDFVAKELGIKLGRFLDGKFSFMPWGLPFAGLAIVLAAPKENRNIALGVVLPASLTSFVSGVTEPIEFTFLFLAPLLFFGFHAFMCALAFMLANLMGVHIGMTFSGGLLDLIIYGMIPVLKGTNFWWTIVVGVAYAPIYFFVFYTWIIKANLPTPGRGGNTKLFTKKDYQAAKSGAAESNVSGNVDPQAVRVIEAFGGKQNISKTANCASRLRFDVVDASLVNEDALKAAGAFGVRKTSNTHVQAIFGPLAESLRVKIDQALNSNDLPSSSSIVSESKPTEVKDTFVRRPDLSDNANDYLKFIDAFGGQSNIQKITCSNNVITFYLYNDIDLNKEYNVSLFDNSSITIKDKEIKLTFDSDPEIAKRFLNQVNKEILSKNENIYSPVELGKLKSLASLNDGVFSDKLVGDGFAVSQVDGRVYSPINGKIVTAFPTGHAYGIQAKNGMNVLVHIGIDTVKLEGRGFKSYVKQGDEVKKGDLLAEVDLNLLRQHNLISDVIVVVTSDSLILPQDVNVKEGELVSTKDIIINKFK